MLIQLLQVIILEILLHIQLRRHDLRMLGLKYQLIVQLSHAQLLQPRHTVHQLILPFPNGVSPLMQLGPLARLQQRTNIGHRNQGAGKHAAVTRLGST